MATITTQAMPLDGAALTYSAASAGGDRYTPGPNTFLHIVNGSGVSVTATIVRPRSVDGIVLTNRAVAVPAGLSRLVPVTSDNYKSVADGLGDITWSATATVTFAVVAITS